MLSKHVPLDIPNPYWKGMFTIPALYLEVHYKLQEKILDKKQPIPCNYLDLSTCENFPRCTCLRCTPKVLRINSRYNYYYYKLNDSYGTADNFLRLFEKKYFNTVSNEKIVSMLRKYVRVVQVCKLDIYQIYAVRISKELFDFMVEKKIYDGFLWIALLDIEFECGTPFLNFLINKNCDILELVLKNVQDYFVNSNSAYKYEKYQKYLPLTICEEIKSIPLQSILLKYGHEKFMLRHSFLLLRAIDYYCEHFFSTKYEQYRHLIPKTHTLVRIYLLMQLFFILKNSLHGSGIIAQSALDIWKALPQSYPTGDEIRSVFLAIFPNYRHRLVETVASYYEEIFPREDLKPRSLKHFSRCTIRKALNANCMLPRGIEKLNIPDIFTSYLNLEC